jgi:hypothetical protein
MNIFNSNNDFGRKKVFLGESRDCEFKHFVETKMRNEGDRYAGYSDEAILDLMEKEFSMYKNASPNKEGEAEAKKSKIPHFKSIGDALKTQNYGQKFTTPQSDRIYVITKGTWGDKSKDKVVKGFDLSTPIDKIDTYSKRTKVKHGGKSPISLPKDERTPSMKS